MEGALRGGGYCTRQGLLLLACAWPALGAGGRAAHLLAVLCPEEPGQALTGSFLPALPTKTPVGAKPLSCHGPASGLFGRPCETTSGMLRTQEGSTGGSQSLASAQD